MSEALFAFQPRSKHGSSAAHMHILTRPSASPHGWKVLCSISLSWVCIFFWWHDEALSVTIVTPALGVGQLSSC